MPLKESIKIILADSQYITSMGLRYLLSQSADLEVVDVVGNRDDLLTSIQSNHPDLVILDYDQPDSFSLEDIPSVIEQCPDTHVLIISSDDAKQNIRQTIHYGIKGFLTKKCREDELHNAIQTILNGGKFFCDRVLNIIMSDFEEEDDKSKAYEQLTDREKEVVQLVADGLTTKQIAKKLYLSPHTVSTHRKNALKKLEISSVPELIKFVIHKELKKL